MIEFCLPREALDRWDQEFPFLSLPFLVGSTYHWGFLDTWIKLIPISVFGLDGGVRLPGDNFWDPDSKQIPFLSLCLRDLGTSAYLMRISGHLVPIRYLLFLCLWWHVSAYLAIFFWTTSPKLIPLSRILLNGRILLTWQYFLISWSQENSSFDHSP